MTKTADEPDITGRRILVVEDQYLLAEDIRRALVGLGAEVVGPAADLASGLALARDGPLDGAVLDVDLGGEKVFALAEELVHRGVPIVFATGYEGWMIPETFRHATQLEKPINPRDLANAIAAAARGLAVPR